MKWLKTIVIAAIAIVSAAATPPTSSPQLRNADWNAVVNRTARGGYLIGNPSARVKLIEYASYSCPHCAQFERDAHQALRNSLIRRGTVSIEYRAMMRNKIDVAVTLLVSCGPLGKFPGNHRAFLLGQDRWLHSITTEQERRWTDADFAASMRMIAAEFKLYEVMARRGYSRSEIDRCLANRTAAEKFAEQTRYAQTDLKVQSTPSFLINGELQNSHDWAALRPRLLELARSILR